MNNLVVNEKYRKYKNLLEDEPENDSYLYKFKKYSSLMNQKGGNLNVNKPIFDNFNFGNNNMTNNLTNVTHDIPKSSNSNMRTNELIGKIQELVEYSKRHSSNLENAKKDLKDFAGGARRRKSKSKSSTKITGYRDMSGGAFERGEYKPKSDEILEGLKIGQQQAIGNQILQGVTTLADQKMTLAEENQRQKEEIERIKRELEEAKTKIEELRKQLEVLTTENDQNKNKITELNEQIKTLERERDEMGEAVTKLKNSLEYLEKTHGEVKTTTGDFQEKVRNALNAGDIQLQTILDAIEKLKKDKTDLETTVKINNEAIARLGREKEEQEAKVKELTEDMVKANAFIYAMEQDTGKTITALSNEVKKYEAGMEALKGKLVEAGIPFAA
jgi:peptidoglycan hydrolase CwlO-like protein